MATGMGPQDVASRAEVVLGKTFGLDPPFGGLERMQILTKADALGGSTASGRTRQSRIEGTWLRFCSQIRNRCLRAS